jgi:aminoglycoside phosphotransferase (APT) family kinase protein
VPVTVVDSASIIPTHQLDAWLGERLPPGALTVERIQGGASNEMFRIARGGRVAVLRRPPEHLVAKGAHDVLRETRVLRALDGTDVPHPRVLDTCDDPAVIGAPFYMMELIDGFAPVEPLPAPFDLDMETRRAMGFALVDGIAALERVDWRAAGLADFGKPEGFLERQVDRWLGQLAKYRTRDIPGLDKVAVWLDENLPAAQEPAIMHGDYQFINVMFSRDTPARLAAIVDWEQSTIGDPLLDLGWLLAGWTDPGEDHLRFGSKYFKDRRGLPTRDELAARYAERTGRALDALDYYVVLALFKLACVLEGSYHRFATGKSTNPMHAKMGPLVLDLAEQARAML